MKTVYIIIAFCAGLFLGHLFFPSEKEIKPPDLTEIKKEKKQIATTDTVFSIHQIVYQKQNDSLRKELKAYKFLLANARKELSGKREQTVVLVNKIKHDTVFRSDTLLVDSLQDQINSVNNVTDTIIVRYQQKDSLMQQMVAIRDSQIVLCNKSFAEINDLAKEQMQREQKLTEDLNTALKQQKRKRAQNKMLAAGMLFVSGVATTLYLKSKP
jgi:hypothetical protein